MAQVGQPQTIPPSSQTPSSKESKPEKTAAVADEEEEDEEGGPVDPTAPDVEKKKEAPEKIIIMHGPNLGSGGKLNPSPKQLEAFYQAMWAKVATEFVDVAKLKEWKTWEHKYDGQLKTMDDMDKAIREMAESLDDRWTIYVSPKDIENARKQRKEGLINIGMLLRKHADGIFHIDGIMFGSPVHASQLREGDVIKSINGKDLSGVNFTEANQLLSGKAGAKITLVASWGGEDHTVELTYANVEEAEVDVDLLPGKIGYVRLPTFMSQKIGVAFIQALAELYQATEGNLNGLVFDMRNNSGGRVDLAIEISSMFLEKGTVVKTSVRSDRRVTVTAYDTIPIPNYLESGMLPDMAKFQHMLQTVPMVILTNGSTASASEITTGALKDNGRARVIGTTSFGKAVGYVPYPLPNGGMLQVTNLSYLTPNGTNIRDKGIAPDEVVENPRDSEDDLQLKAAHSYLMTIVKARNKQLADARKLSGQGQPGSILFDPQGDAARTLWGVVIVLGSAAVLWLVYRRLTRRKRRGR